MRRHQQGFGLIQVMIMLVFMGFLTAWFYNMQIEAYAMQSAAAQGGKIAQLVSAIRQAAAGDGTLHGTGALGPLFADGTSHTGTLWLKDSATCPGGGADKEYLSCRFENEPTFGDPGVIYRTTIQNTGTKITATLTIATPDGLKGFTFRGQNRIDLNCTAQAVAEGSLGQVDYNAAISESSCHPETGVIEFRINHNAAHHEAIRIDGLNSPTATINWNNQNVDSMGVLESSKVVDADDNSFELDPSGTSTLNEVGADRVTARNMITDNITVNSTLQQLDGTATNNFAGTVEFGTGGNVTEISAGDIYTDGVIMNRSGASGQYFLDVDGVSRLKDVSVTSRRGALLSDLLPNYVQKSGHYVTASDPSSLIIDKPTCGPGGQTRLIITPQTQSMHINRLNGGRAEPTSTQAYRRVYAQDFSATEWIVYMFVYSFGETDGSGTVTAAPSWQYDGTATAVATTYCFYG